MKSMKVLYIVSTLKKSGPNNVLYNIVKNLPRSKMKIDILTLSKSPRDNLELEFLNLGIKIHSLNLSRLQGVFSNYKGLDEVITRIAPDIIHSHGLRGDMISASRIKNIPTFTTLHNYPYSDYIPRYGRFKGRIMASFHLKKIKNIDVPVSCSHSIAELYREKNINTKVIQNGVDADTYKPVNSKKSDKLRDKLNLPKNKNIFISVGHLSQLKDPITLIRAFNKMRLKNSLLLFLGDGELYNECKNKVEDFNYVRLVGRVPNVREYLQASDYFISSSTTEGLPNSVLEAMSTGLPVCLSDIGPHREIVNINPKSGIVFQPRNVEGVCKAVKTILKFDYGKASEASLGIIEQELNAENMALKYLKLYSEYLTRTD